MNASVINVARSSRFAAVALVAWLTGLAIPVAAPAQVPVQLPIQDSQPQVLRPESAFRYTVEPAAGQVRVRWDIQPGYYLYRERMGFESRSPGVTLGPAEMPAGKPYEDEFFGRMEVYRGAVEIRIPLPERPAGATTLQLALKSQGCADVGVCYPPQVWTADVRLPPAAGDGGAGTGSGLGALLGALNPSRPDGDQPLPVEQAFRWSVEAVDPFTLQVVFDIEEGYYLYRHTLAATATGEEVQLGPPQLPPGTPKWDEEYGDTLVFHDTVTMGLPLTRSGPGVLQVPLILEFQGCKEGSLCYPPQEITTTVTLPAAGPEAGNGGPAPSGPGAPSEQDRLSALIADGNLAAMLALFAGLGLLLSFTPCCLPMIPILSGILVGQGANLSNVRAFLLALAYVLGMAVTYTAIGAVFAAAGQQVQAIMQQPWVVVTVAALFVALALSMFGLFDLQLPTSWQTRLTLVSGRQRSGSFIGAGIMGMISALVVTTCVTPPLVAALTVIARSGDVARGAMALFALAIGMGLPLLAIGASAGRLMPKAGPWMVSVKAAFGLMMLGMAVWMLDRLLPGTLTLALWAVLLVIGGVFLGAFAPMAEAPSMARKLGKGFGIVALLYGAALLIGALAGNEDPLRPLQFASREAAAPRQESPFTRIKSVEDLDRALVRAGAEGRPVLLDFYADWCASCKEMEKYTFPHEDVRDALANAVLLQADVTDVDAQDQALMRRFDIVGPPTILFFTADGTERPSFRVVGFQSGPEFAARARAAFGRATTT